MKTIKSLISKIVEKIKGIFLIVLFIIIVLFSASQYIRYLIEVLIDLLNLFLWVFSSIAMLVIYFISFFDSIKN